MESRLLIDRYAVHILFKFLKLDGSESTARNEPEAFQPFTNKGVAHRSVAATFETNDVLRCGL